MSKLKWITDHPLMGIILLVLAVIGVISPFVIASLTEHDPEVKPITTITGYDYKYASVNATIFLDGKESQDDGVLDYQWKINDVVHSTDSTIEYTFINSGKHEIELIVTDDDDNQSNDFLTIMVNEPRFVIYGMDFHKEDCQYDDPKCDPELVINRGETVSWQNQDSESHNILSGIIPESDGIFDTNLLKSGQSYAFVFKESGEFDYFCSVHPWVTGTIKVND